MPQTIVETRCYSQPRKCDVPVSNFVTFGKGDESPSGSDSSLDGLFTNGQSSKNSPCGGRETVDKAISSLSVLSNNEKVRNRGKENCDLDLYSPNLFNGGYSNCNGINGDLVNNYEGKEIRYFDSLVDSSPNKSLNSNNMGIVKDTESEVLGDFSDLLSSITSPNEISNGSYESKYVDAAFLVPNGLCKVSKNNWKYSDSNSQNNGTLSDILSSISLEDNNSTQKGCNLSFDAKLDLKFDQGHALEASRFNPNCKADNLKHNGYETQDILSDFLLSIPFEGDLKQSKIKLSSGSNHHLNDNKDANVNGLDSNFNSEFQNRDNLSDILSSISSLRDNPVNDTSTTLNGISKCDSQNELLSSLLDFNIDNHRIPTSSINVPKPTSIKPSTYNQKNMDFSFFSVSPDNGFSEMVSKLRMDVDLEVNATNDNSTGMSMLDLFKSVNSDSSSSLSEYLSTESEGSWSDKNVSETKDEGMEIDLSTCVKTSDNTPSISSEKYVTEDCTDARENDDNELQPRSFMFKTFPENNYSKHRRMKNQSLFAKCLSCKSKKNPVLMQEVAGIKSELFEKYFCRPLHYIGDKKSIVKDLIVDQSNDCMITPNDYMIIHNGHHICTSKGLGCVEST